jgi:hypothetical protein
MSCSRPLRAATARDEKARPWWRKRAKEKGGRAMARKLIKVVQDGRIIRYIGMISREARQIYYKYKRPYTAVWVELGGVRVCPDCFSILDPSEDYRCWDCEPYGSYPDECVYYEDKDCEDEDCEDK